MEREINKILIANRGEIALRIQRTAHEMGIQTVAVFSDADSRAPFVHRATEAIALGGSKPADTYLNVDKIIAAAKATGTDAIHPGYGFLSENASFARRCLQEGLIFIGPSPEAMEKLGSKASAKTLMRQAGVPVVPGYEGEDQSIGRFRYEAAEIGFPLLIKAAAGGGGRGMRIVNSAEELESAIESAAREAKASFGDGTLLMEKYFLHAKHIEFQIFGDEHGQYIHLYDRECSMQRRYQKIIEEAPSPSISNELREEMGNAALAAAKAAQYTNAGTVEFLLDPDGHFYFLEVNARLQVEHPVTEMVLGLDLVALQIEVAKGLPIRFAQDEIHPYGHAVECRICAEDPENNFAPSIGQLLHWQEPSSPVFARIDSGVEDGSEVSVYYDSMLAKVIDFAQDRSQVIRMVQGALSRLVVLGLDTNIDFLGELLSSPEFSDGTFDTKLIERKYSHYQKSVSTQTLHEVVIAALVYEWQQRQQQQLFTDSLNGWRNIFYSLNEFSVAIRGEIIKAHYRYQHPGHLHVTLRGEKYEVTWGRTENEKLYLCINQKLFQVLVAGQKDLIFIHHSTQGHFKLKVLPRFAEPEAHLQKDGYYASMPGEVVQVLVQAGNKVKAGQKLMVLSSMKMETAIEAQSDGVVREVLVQEKSFVAADTKLLTMETDSEN